LEQRLAGRRERRCAESELVAGNFGREVAGQVFSDEDGIRLWNQQEREKEILCAQGGELQTRRWG